MILSNYWNSALRSLAKKKGFSAINITGLAIGMAAALLILTYVAFEYSYDNMHTRADRIFRVEARFFENGEMTDNWASSSAGYATAMKRNLAGQQTAHLIGQSIHIRCFSADTGVRASGTSCRFLTLVTKHILTHK